MRFIITITLIVTGFNLFGQNLIENGGFEKKPVSKIFTRSWDLLNATLDCTPDYFHKAQVSKDYQPLTSYLGGMKAHTGIGMASILIEGKKENGCERTYLRGNFIEPLQKEVTYNIRLFVHITPESKLSMESSIGVFISDAKTIGHVNTKKAITTLSPQYSVKITDNEIRSEWKRIEFDYTSKGNELYIVIGNFITTQEISNSVYIYIDNVSVSSKIHKWTTIIPKFGKSFVLENIQFEPSKAILLPTANTELKKIVNLFERYPNLKLEIGGHTDNSIGEIDNMKLSQLRAKKIKNALIKLGISENKLITKAYGDTKPKKSNDTPEGKATNRRVEFKVIGI